MPLILTNLETEIRKIMVWGQPGQIVCETPSQPVAGCGGEGPSFQAMQEAEFGRIMVAGHSGQKK
jgi:hypothetical protein